MSKQIKIYDFTKPELDYFIANCNFSKDELEYFNLRASYKSNVQISLEMNISESKVSKLARNVKSKVKRVL